jgi:hypothetical protein
VLWEECGNVVWLLIVECWMLRQWENVCLFGIGNWESVASYGNVSVGESLVSSTASLKLSHSHFSTTSSHSEEGC